MKRIPIVILITALCVSLFLLFDTCSNNLKPLEPDKFSVKEELKQVETIDNNYHNAMTQMKTQADSLSKELGKAQQQLVATKIKLQKAKVNVINLVEKDTSGLSLEQKLKECDTLKLEIKDYVVWVDSTQLGYETTLKQLHQLVAIKDSELVVCHVAYINLKEITDDNLNRERQLTHDLEIAYKQKRRKQTQNKVLVAGILILSGITATFFINSKK